MGADGGIRIMRHAEWPDVYALMSFRQEYGEPVPVAELLRIRDTTICGVRYLVCYEDTSGYPYNDEHYCSSQRIEEAMHTIEWANGPAFDPKRWTDGDAARAQFVMTAERTITEALQSPDIERDRQIYAAWKWFLAHTEYHELCT